MLGISVIAFLDAYLTPKIVAESGFLHISSSGIAYLALIALILGGGSRFVLKNKKITWFWGFIIPYGSTSVENAKIYKGNMFGAAPIPAIIIEYRGIFGLKRTLRMNIDLFSKKTVAQFLRDIKEIYPAVPMDTACKKLMGNGTRGNGDETGISETGIRNGDKYS